MNVSPVAVLDRLTRGRGELAIKYSAVSVIGVLMGQSLLALFSGILGWDAVLSNILAVSITAIPAFLLNKRWVWSSDGKISFRREIVPFWTFTGMGLALSTGLVALADSVSDSHLLVMAANLGGFGVLWVAKFLFLDQVMFGRREIEEVLSQEAPEPV